MSWLLPLTLFVRFGLPFLAADTLTTRHRVGNNMGRNCPVTFSIGAATYREPLESVEEMLARADELMYATKNEAKNQIKIEVV